MRKKLKIAAVLLISTTFILISSGCWDALAINDRDICTAIILDKTGGVYTFYVEVAQLQGGSPQEQGGQGNSKTAIIKGSGQNLIEARNDIDRGLSKPIFLGAVPSLILTRSVAEEGINEYLYRLRDIQDYRKTIKILITSAKPEDLLSIEPENSESVGFAIEHAFNTQVNLGNIAVMRLQDVFQRTYSSNESYILSNLEIVNGQPVIFGYSAFESGRDIGDVPIEETGAIAFLNADMANKPKKNYVIPFKNNRITIEASCMKRDIKADYKNGEITFILNMSFDGLEMYPATSDPITSEDKKQIKLELKQIITKDIEDTIETSQNGFKYDYLEFSEYFRTAYPYTYEKMDWDEEFPKAHFVVNVDANVIPDKALDYGAKRDPI